MLSATPWRPREKIEKKEEVLLLLAVAAGHGGKESPGLEPGSRGPGPPMITHTPRLHRRDKRKREKEERKGVTGIEPARASAHGSLVRSLNQLHTLPEKKGERGRGKGGPSQESNLGHVRPRHVYYHYNTGADGRRRRKKRSGTATQSRTGVPAFEELDAIRYTMAVTKGKKERE